MGILTIDTLVDKGTKRDKGAAIVEVEHPKYFFDSEVSASYNGNIGRFWDSLQFERMQHKYISDDHARSCSSSIGDFTIQKLRTPDKSQLTLKEITDTMYQRIQICEIDKWIYMFNQINGYHQRITGASDYVKENSKTNREGIEKYRGIWIFYHTLALFRAAKIGEIQKEIKKEFDECCNIFVAQKVMAGKDDKSSNAKTEGELFYEILLNEPERIQFGRFLFAKANLCKKNDLDHTTDEHSQKSEESNENEVKEYQESLKYLPSIK